MLRGLTKTSTVIYVAHNIIVKTLFNICRLIDWSIDECWFKWDSNLGPTNARLNRPSGGGTIGAWSSKVSDTSQWIQVAFLEVTRITKIATQGRYDHYDQWVTKFKVSYSLDGVHFFTQSKVSSIKQDVCIFSQIKTILNDIILPMWSNRFIHWKKVLQSTL